MARVPRILVVDDEPDVEALFRQQFRRDLRAGRFIMEFAYSASAALERIRDEQARETQMADLVQVAVTCFLTGGAAI